MSPLCGQKAALVLEDKDKLREKTLQNQEAELFCSKIREKLDRVLARDQQFIKMTNADVRAVKRLQVSGSLFKDSILRQSRSCANFLMQKSVKVFLQVRRGSSDPSLKFANELASCIRTREQRWRCCGICLLPVCLQREASGFSVKL